MTGVLQLRLSKDKSYLEIQASVVPSNTQLHLQ